MILFVSMLPYTIILLFLTPVISFCQGISNSIAPAALRVGTYSNKQVDAFSFTANQASLVAIQKISAGIYSERRFMLSELSHYLAVVVLPVSSGSFGFKGSHFGFSHYQESQAGIAYAKKMGDMVSIGVQFNYSNISVPPYGNASVVGFEAGTLLYLTDRLQAGVYVNNPLSGKRDVNQGKIYPGVYAFGIGYDVSDKILLSAEIIQEEWQLININLSFQYKVVDQFLAGVGLSTNTSTGWFKFAFSWKPLQLGVVASFHPQLGISPGLQVIVHHENKVK